MKSLLEEEWKIARLNSITGNYLEYIHSNSVLKLYQKGLKYQSTFLVHLSGGNSNYHMLLERYPFTKPFKCILGHIQVSQNTETTNIIQVTKSQNEACA